MRKIITELTPLSDKDFFYLIDRTKDSFTFPVHRHKEYELNFVENCRGSQRVVGDSIETLGDYDLCLVGNGIEHGWEQGECRSSKIREITIQFSADLFGEEFLKKNIMSPVSELLKESSKGISFGMGTIMRVYAILRSLTEKRGEFERMLDFLQLLHELSLSDDRRVLSSSSFANVTSTSDSRRVRKVQDFIEKHYKSEIRLEEVSSLAGMAPTSFSRFFKMRTGKSLSDYILDIRIGHATRLLMSSIMTVNEIGYDCGFNNISNFNRIFKKKKQCTPKEFRELYQRHQILV